MRSLQFLQVAPPSVTGSIRSLLLLFILSQRTFPISRGYQISKVMAFSTLPIFCVFVILISLVRSELKCEDKTKSCDKWAKTKKLCDENPKYKKQRFYVSMSKLCKKTCLMCGDDDATLFDGDSRCHTYFKKGYCEMRPHQGFMLKRCKYSCRNTIRSGIMSPGRGNFHRNTPPAKVKQHNNGNLGQQQVNSDYSQQQQYPAQHQQHPAQQQQYPAQQQQYFPQHQFAQQHMQQYPQGSQQYDMNFGQQQANQQQAQNFGQQQADQQQAQNFGQQQYNQQQIQNYGQQPYQQGQYSLQNDQQQYGNQVANSGVQQAQQQTASLPQQDVSSQSPGDVPVQLQDLTNTARRRKVEKSKGKHVTHHDAADDADDDVN